MKKVIIIISLIGIITSCNNSNKQINSLYSPRVDSLVANMTLDEKLGQMMQMCFSTITLDGSKTLSLNTDLFKEQIQKNHIGSFLSGSDSAQKWHDFIYAIQKIAVDSTRLGIPLVIGIDHVHGANYIAEGTILPHNITLSCSFNREMAKNAAKITAIETAPVALSWNFSPVLDIGKNAYWPRFYETFGEDPLVCTELGEAYITEYENCEEIKPVKLSACAKHFIGYSDPKYGYDRAPAEIPDQILYEQFVPSFKKAIDAGVKTVMVNSGEVNGIPVHASNKLLTDLLRNQLGFNGVVVTDIKDIDKLVEMHKNYSTHKEAVLASINAGIDMYMACNSLQFIEDVKELISEGKLTEERIDISVKRILKFKEDLGLFDNPYPDQSKLKNIGTKENYAAAQNAAEESIVLLKNNGILPLKDQKILLTGLGANSKLMMNGAWTLDWLGAPEELQPANTKTLNNALRETFGDENVKLFNANYLTSENKEEYKKQLIDCDVVIAAIGEKPYSEFMGNINDLNLEKGQRDLVNFAIENGKKVIIILLEGRPRLITTEAEKADAVLFAGHPGTAGAIALSNILSGKVNPSGKLSFTYPYSAGHTHPYYVKPSEYNIYWRPDTVRRNLYDFGHGLSYSKIVYSNLQISDTILNKEETITATVEITNKSDIAAKEAVLWFISDKYGKITRPIKLLKKFEKIDLPSGIKYKAEFEIIPKEHLSYPDENGDIILEEGEFSVSIGGMEKSFYLKGTSTK